MDNQYREKRMTEAVKGREELRNILVELFEEKEKIATDEMPNTVGSLVSHLGYLKLKYNDGEMKLSA